MKGRQDCPSLGLSPRRWLGRGELGDLQGVCILAWILQPRSEEAGGGRAAAGLLFFRAAGAESRSSRGLFFTLGG